MSVLIVELDVRPGQEDNLAAAFAQAFRPAIAAQPGFQAVSLLRPGRGRRWLLEIRFVDEPKRLAWVASPAHQEAWPHIERLCAHVGTELFEPV